MLDEDIEIECIDSLLAHDRLGRGQCAGRRSSTPIGGTSPRMFFIAAELLLRPSIRPTPTVIARLFQLLSPKTGVGSEIFAVAVNPSVAVIRNERERKPRTASC